MSMLAHIQQFAMHIAEDGHGYGRHVGDLTMRLPERPWMALVAEVCERAKYAPRGVATPRSMYAPITIATSYGFNVVVEGPERPMATQGFVTKVDHETRTVEMRSVPQPIVRVSCVTCGAPHGKPCNDATHDNVTEQAMRGLPDEKCPWPLRGFARHRSSSCWFDSPECPKCGAFDCIKNHAEFM